MSEMVEVCLEDIDPNPMRRLRDFPFNERKIAALQRSDDLSQFAPAHKACHRTKTNTDLGVIAKAKRCQAKHMGVSRRKNKIPYRKFNGEIVWPS